MDHTQVTEEGGREGGGRRGGAKVEVEPRVYVESVATENDNHSIDTCSKGETRFSMVRRKTNIILCYSVYYSKGSKKGTL